MVAISITTNDLNIHTDCFYVHTNLLKVIKHKHISTDNWNHRDLWHIIQHNLNTLPRLVTTIKVKGHATHNDVANGLITNQNLYGNHAADRLATQGAKLVAPDKLTIAAHHNTFSITATQQIRIFNILTKRWHLCKKMGLQSDDDPLDTPQVTSENLTPVSPSLPSPPSFNSCITINDLPILDPLTPQHKWNASPELINNLHKFIRNLKHSSIAAKSQYTTYCELALEFELEHNLTVQTNANTDTHPHVKAVNMYGLIFRLFDICNTVLPKALVLCLTDNLTKYGMEKCKHTTSACFLLRHATHITQTLHAHRNGDPKSKTIFSRLQTPLTQQDCCTIGNKIRIKLNLSPTLHTAKFDRLREEKIKLHNEPSNHKHIIHVFSYQSKFACCMVSALKECGTY